MQSSEGGGSRCTSAPILDLQTIVPIELALLVSPAELQLEVRRVGLAPQVDQILDPIVAIRRSLRVVPQRGIEPLKRLEQRALAAAVAPDDHVERTEEDGIGLERGLEALEANLGEKGVLARLTLGRRHSTARDRARRARAGPDFMRPDQRGPWLTPPRAAAAADRAAPSPTRGPAAPAACARPRRARAPRRVAAPAPPHPGPPALAHAPPRSTGARAMRRSNVPARRGGSHPERSGPASPAARDPRHAPPAPTPTAPPRSRGR